MNMKRIVCMVLSLLLALSLTACHASKGDGGTGNSDKDIDTLASDLRDDFPLPAAGYNNMSDEEFCKYFYELNNANDAYISDTCTGVDSVATMMSNAVLQQFSTELTAYQTAYTQWGASFTKIAAKVENAPTYPALKTEAKDLINTFSNLLYGKDMVS